MTVRRSSRIRVLQVLEATAGGTRRHLNDVLTHLPRDQFEFIVACSAERDASFCADISAFQRSGVEVHLIRMSRSLSPLEDYSAVRKLRALMIGRRCDVVHLHSSKAGFLGRLAAFGLDVPVIYSPHAFAFLQGGVLGPFAFVAEKLLAPRTHTLVAVSKAEARLAADSSLFPASAVRAIPIGIDADLQERNAGRLAPIREPFQVRRFALLGELRAQKRPLLFLEAALEALQRGVRAHFILPARGCLAAAAAEFVASHSLRPHVTFVDTAQSLNAAHRQMDVGVLPSKYEGLPYALLESLALRRPVLGSDIGVFQDTLGRLDPRLLFRSGDSSALAAAFELWSCLPTEELHEVGRRGRLLTEKEHGLQDWSSELASVYRQVCSRPCTERGHCHDRPESAAAAGSLEPTGVRSTAPSFSSASAHNEAVRFHCRCLHRAEVQGRERRT